ncbi:MAG: hypothetical protein ISS81_01690 [Candidatus Marinimicrobia bacterium]|nr:hypothetical protein [Candidatus Neomarinimicrobiota bacterium]
MIAKFEVKEEKYRIMIITILLAICCFLTYYFHVVLKDDRIFTHFFYIPIILASRWWQRRGFAVAVFLAAWLILSRFFIITDVGKTSDFFRSLIFIVISSATVFLSERTWKAQKRIKHLNDILKAIRSINQLIVVEKDRKSLLQKACDTMIETRDYYAAWLGFLKDSENFAIVVGSGFRKDLSQFCEQVVGGDHPPCIKNALAQKEKLLIEHKSRECRDCLFKDACMGEVTVIIRIEYANRLFGLFAISMGADIANNEEEKMLLYEVAGDIAFALYNIELEEEINRLAKFPSENPSPVLRVKKDGTILFANKAATLLLNAWGG